MFLSPIKTNQVSQTATSPWHTMQYPDSAFIIAFSYPSECFFCFIMTEMIIAMTIYKTIPAPDKPIIKCKKLNPKMEMSSVLAALFALLVFM